jgi:hypothetical protein
MRLFLNVFSASGCAETRTLPIGDASGWKDLTSLQGWTRVPIPATAQLNPQSQWRFDAKERVLICEGDKGHEMLRSEAQYSSQFVFHVEWRFKPIAGETRGITAASSSCPPRTESSSPEAKPALGR